MMKLARLTTVASILVSLVVFASRSVAQDSAQATGQPAPPAAAPDPVTALKQNLAASNTAIKAYEWVETTTISVKGEQKSSTQNRCYYDATGKLTKTPLGGEAGKTPGGVRGKVAAKKKEEMSAAVKQAMKLVESYFPLDPALIQKAKDEGRFAVRPADASGRVGMDLKSYKKPGDQVSIDLDSKAMRLMKVAISSYNTAMDKDAVNATSEFTTLPDGTTCAVSRTLELKAESAVIKVANSGHKKT